MMKQSDFCSRGTKQLSNSFTVFLCRGADPNIENEAGLTVYDLAYAYMEQELVDILESYGGTHGSNYSEEYMEEYLGDYN